MNEAEASARRDRNRERSRKLAQRAAHLLLQQSIERELDNQSLLGPDDCVELTQDGDTIVATVVPIS